jgi:hypothetical protein
MPPTDNQAHYNTPAVQIGNAVRDGDEFVMLVRSKQSEGFQIWSSVDKYDTPRLIEQASKQLDLTPTT